MIKNPTQLEKRKEFSKLVINHPDKAAELLESRAKELKNCKYLYERINVLADILFLSTRTIENDVS